MTDHGAQINIVQLPTRFHPPFLYGFVCGTFQFIHCIGVDHQFAFENNVKVGVLCQRITLIEKGGVPFAIDQFHGVGHFDLGGGRKLAQQRIMLAVGDQLLNVFDGSTQDLFRGPAPRGHDGRALLLCICTRSKGV